MTIRPPILDESALTPDQQSVFDDIKSGPRGIVEGPLRVWLQSPGLARHAQALGAYCRYGTALSPRLSELAIIIVGAHWKAGFEWHVHAPIAIAAGIDPAAVEAIRLGKKPVLGDPDADAVYGFASELNSSRAVSDRTYEMAARHLGTEALVDLIGIIGYYTLISMTINAFNIPLPSGSPEPFADICAD